MEEQSREKLSEIAGFNVSGFLNPSFRRIKEEKVR
jgi:hypothetical protein